ncbi:UPF0488 protein C8orf33 homolog [Pelobates fuscus]|uniref:UPF0488 protein C8orf33 homolog n=1 Tax=Pelobates fuscus TaxID=191477 RepID=UPI002FE4C5A1
MEEAPQGSFEDELDWCIRKLETGLLRRNPSPKQVSDAEKVLQVLRSRKAPFVKKRSVMNRVFGNYRLKMTEERKAQEKAAANLPDAHIQEGTSQDSQSVCYRKCSKDTPASSSSWFPVSDNTFNFNFCVDEVDQGTDSGTEDAENNQNEHVTDGDSHDVNQASIIVPNAASGFSFNFQILDDAASTFANLEIGGQGSVEKTSAENMTTATEPNAVSQNHTELQAAVNKTGASVTSSNTVKHDEAKNVSGDSPSKKKKKKGSKGKGLTGEGQKVSKAETPNKETRGADSSSDASQSGGHELSRELDWCVEQLEIGLQRQKSTPKQVEEALRAIKTLRSEKAALVKKRQVMRAMFGDYRRKMEEERQKQLKLMQTAAQSARMKKVSTVQRQKTSKVFRQSIRKTCKNPNTAPVTLALDSPAEPEATSSQQIFVFRSSDEPFCFNFQL